VQDLKMARDRIHGEGLRLSIVKDGHLIYESASRGICGFLNAIESKGSALEGASVADRIVGRAIALLCAYVKVKAVYAMTLSKEAEAVLEHYSIHYEVDEAVDCILDNDWVTLCPFEKLVSGISNPKVAYEKLTAFCDQFRR
jgi:hypothetical protein